MNLKFLAPSVAALLAVAGCVTVKDPRVHSPDYTEEQADQILARVNALQGREKQCLVEYEDAYKRSVYEWCVATGSGGEAEGCEDIAYAYNPIRVTELGLAHCKKSHAEDTPLPD